MIKFNSRTESIRPSEPYLFNEDELTVAGKGSKHEFAVIGLGRFGTSVATTLVARGHTVLGIDSDPALVQRHSHEITQTVAFDSRDEEALKEIDISSYNTAIVAIGTNFEANIMTTVALKALKVKRIVCKATTKMQKDILLRIGAERVVLPEYEAGERLASILTTPAVVGQLELTPGTRIASVKIPNSLIGLSLEEGDMNGRFSLQIVALQRGTAISVHPKKGTVMKEGDMLVIVGGDDSIRKLSDHI